MAAGSSTTATVSTAVVSGSAQSVALSATGAPSGVTVSFSPASVSAGGTSTMTVSTTSAAAAGTSTITVTGTGASGTHSATLGLTVTTSGGGGGGTVRYEAENATISQGILETIHTGYSGTGYVNCDNVVGSYVEFTVTAAAAGNASVVIRYSNGTTADRPSSVTVNGTVVNAGLSFPVTTDWNTWANDTITVALQAGSNTIRLTGTTANGPANIDYLDVTPSGGGGGGTTTTTYQAESATLSQAAVATNHTGFTGTGFVDYTNVTGSYVEFSVTSAAAGTATVTIRFANGTTVNRPMDIAVNGTVVSSGVSFTSTGTWDTWQTATVTVPVNAGTNTVRATATTANGGPNVDAVTVVTPN